MKINSDKAANENDVSYTCSDYGASAILISSNKLFLEKTDPIISEENNEIKIQFAVNVEIEHKKNFTIPKTQVVPATNTYEFSITNNRKWWIFAICVNSFKQSSEKQYLEFVSSSNGGKNFSLVLGVEAGSFNEETNRYLVCEIRDTFTLKTKAGLIRDLVEVDNGKTCDIPNWRLMQNSFLPTPSNRYSELFFYIHQDMTARLDTSFNTVKTLSSDTNALIATFNDRIKNKVGSYTIKNYRIIDVDWFNDQASTGDHTVEVSISKLPVDGQIVAFSVNPKGKDGVFYFMISQNFLNEETAYEKMTVGGDDISKTDATGAVYFIKKYFDANTNFGINSTVPAIQSGRKYYYYYMTTNLHPLLNITKIVDVKRNEFTTAGSFSLMLSTYIGFMIVAICSFIFL